MSPLHCLHLCSASSTYAPPCFLNESKGRNVDGTHRLRRGRLVGIPPPFLHFGALPWSVDVHCYLQPSAHIASLIGSQCSSSTLSFHPPSCYAIRPSTSSCAPRPFTQTTRLLVFCLSAMAVADTDHWLVHSLSSSFQLTSIRHRSRRCLVVVLV